VEKMAGKTNFSKSKETAEQRSARLERHSPWFCPSLIKLVSLPRLQPDNYPLHVQS